jgi:ribosomal protein L40E
MVEAGRRTALHDVEDFTEVSITDNNTKPTDQADDVVVVTSIANMQCREKAAPVKKQKQLSFAVVSKYACVVVGHAFLLFGLLTFIVVISLRAPMPTWQRILFITLASILNAIVFAIYWITMATPAGSAPDTYNIPDVYVLRHEQGPILGINEKAATVLPAPVHTRDRDGKLRFCRACVAVKPDRAHHCYSCGECTLRFDHHVCCT